MTSKIDYARIAKENKSVFKDDHFHLRFESASGFKFNESFTRLGDTKQFFKEVLVEGNIDRPINTVEVTVGTLGLSGKTENVTKWFLQSYLDAAKKAEKDIVTGRISKLAK